MNYTIFKNIQKLAGYRSPIDLFMILISNKIRYLYIFVLLFMWFKNESSNKAARNSVVSIGISLIIHTIIKLFYYKPRPFVYQRVGILIPSKMDSSFPSKHTMLVFALSTSIFLYNRVLGAIMWGLSVLTGVSRIWVGHHYPSDIMGSAVISTIVSMLVNKTSKRSYSNKIQSSAIKNC